MAATKIMIVRHAERPPDDGSIDGVSQSGAKDPKDLIVRGWQRAGALFAFLRPRMVTLLMRSWQHLTLSSHQKWRIIAPVCGLSTQ
jgi:hypothetical protein